MNLQKIKDFFKKINKFFIRFKLTKKNIKKESKASESFDPNIPKIKQLKK